MRAVVCRVNRACVSVGGVSVASIEQGLLVYLGIMVGDDSGAVRWMADKLCSLRLFPDAQGKMNRSVVDIGGGLLLIPNFTLAGRTRKGTRPSFTDAAAPPEAERLFNAVAECCAGQVQVGCGQFGAHMHIDSMADGPVTVIVASPSGD